MEKTTATGADWFDAYTGPDSGLPLVGSSANYLNFDLPEVQEAIRQQAPAEVRELVEWDIRIARGETEGFVEYYAGVPKDCRCFLLLARMAVMYVFLTKDIGFFRKVYADVDRFPSLWPSPYGRMAVEWFMGLVRQMCYIPDGYPEWMVRFDCTSVPGEWHHQAGYVTARMLLVKCKFEAALAMASAHLFFNRVVKYSHAIDTWMALVCAVACREQGRHEEKCRWYKMAVELAGPKGFFIPFLSYSLGSGSPLDIVLDEEAPDLLPTIRKFDDVYYESLILVRNFLTGSHVTTLLGRREFYIACCLSKGLSYKEIADRTGLSVGRVRNIISDIYTKLSIHSRIELSGVVW